MVFNIIDGSVFLWKFHEIVHVMDSRLGEPHSKPECGGEQENSFPASARNQIPFIKPIGISWLYI
jgi:hypothetical protein